jgi:hypothetical protein
MSWQFHLKNNKIIQSHKSKNCNLPLIMNATILGGDYTKAPDISNKLEKMRNK